MIVQTFQLYEVAVQESWRTPYEESDDDGLIQMPKTFYTTIQRLSKMPLNARARGDGTKNRKFHAVLDNELLTVATTAVWNKWRSVMGNDDFPGGLWCTQLELRTRFRSPTMPSAKAKAVNKLLAIRDEWLERVDHKPNVKLKFQNQSVSRHLKGHVVTQPLTETEYCIVKAAYERGPIDTPTLEELCQTQHVYKHASNANRKLKKLRIKVRCRYNVGYSVLIF